MPDLKKMLTLEALSEALPSWLKRSTKPEYNADEIDSTLTTNQFVTASDKDNWNAKGTYSKPSGGIPKSDLSSIVQTSLEKADSALQSETDPTVPSWAKQTNKPSYTQDEVADGSTYKRVTQTEKNAWNGKQNALSTTQMNAVNSGITSAGVAQISTNQANILYGLNTGVKNLLIIKSTFTNNGLTSVQQPDGYTVKITGTPTGGNSIAWSEVIKITESGTYKVKLTLSGTGASCYLYDVTTSTTVREYYSSNTYDATLTANHEYAMYTYSATAVDATISAMLCTAAAYEQSTDHMPPALKNYDLTRLEAEDRAALAEVVDSGAKNLIDCSVDNIKSLNSSSMYSWNGNTVTAYGRTATVNADKTITVAAGTGSAEFWLKVANYTYASGVSYVLSGCPTNGPTTTYYTESDNLNLRDIGSGVVINSATTDALYIVVKTTGSTPALTFKPMLCTLADWRVSQKFVPHCKSNYELTQYTDGCSLGTVAKSSGSLDNITKNSFEVYSASVTGKPVDNEGNTSAFTGLCKTDVYNSSEAMQTLTRLSNGHRWVRTKTAGTWNPWIEMTTLKTNLNVSASESGQLELANLIAYKSNDQVTVSVKCIVKTALQANTVGRTLLNVSGAATISGSCILNAICGMNVLPCWAYGQSIWIRHNTDIPANSEIFISGIYPCQ